MNRTQLAVVLGAVLLGGAAFGYWFAQQGMLTRTSSAASDVSTSSTEKRKVLYWHDPMVPNVRFDKPGKSPYMDMQLVPVYADEGAGGAAVRVSDTVSQNLGIRLGKVEKVDLRARLSAVGSVAFDEGLLELVQARVEGYITHLYVKAPLERVRRGQPLAQIVSPAWISAQEEYLALLSARSERGQAIRDAARRRLAVLGVPEATIRNIETQSKTNATTTIAAPIDGVVTELGVRDGASFMAGAPLFRINGLTSVWVIAQLPEAQVSLVTMGSSVTARATAWPGKEFKGRILALLPDIDAQTRTMPIRIGIENPHSLLAPGMFVSLTLDAAAGAPQLVVPSEAVIMTGERNVVIVARDGDGFDVADVTVGAEAEGKTAILSGLKQGQLIVVSGQFLIDSEASLKSTVSRLTSRGPSPAPQRTTVDAAAGEASHLTQGRITAIAAQSVTIEHEPVPSLQWGAMTTTFMAPAQGLPPGLKVGDRVSFAFSKSPDGYQIDRITRLDAAPAEHEP
jgi:membrane fusion protein, copper/silver efflux system